MSFSPRKWPWSVQTITAVSSRRPVRSNVSSRRPNHASIIVSLRAVLRANLAAVTFGDHALLDRAHRVRRPDQMPRTGPVGVVHRRVRLRRVERLVRIELVDEQEEPFVGRALPARSSGMLRASTRGPGKSSSPRNQPRELSYGECPRPNERRADPRRVGPRPPRVALVPALVVPRGEVDVIVLAAGLEEMRMVGDELGDDPRPAQQHRDRLLPELDRSPRPPQEVERADEEVVAGRHAGQRPGVVLRESHRVAGEPVEVRRLELGAAVRAEHVPVQGVEQHHDDIPGLHSREATRVGTRTCSSFF